MRAITGRCAVLCALAALAACDDSSSPVADGSVDAQLDLGADSAAPDSTVADSTVADSTVADSTAPDSTVADSTVADSTAPDSTVADSTAPDSEAHDSAMPDSAAPDSAAPDSAPPVPNIAFVTSQTHVPGDLAQVSGATSGLDGADILCNQAAAAASLPGTYRAWLSTSSVHALDRLTGARGWVLTDGTPFADQPAMLASGAHWSPLNRDENGVLVSGLVVTGTSALKTCSDWSSTSGSTVGGAANEMGRFWTSGKVPPCSGSIASRLYCFGIDHNTVVTPTQASGRVAFVSQGTFVPGPAKGITAADALCQTEATAAALPGTYQALLAAGGTTALSRFNTAGAMWVRADGIPIGTLADLLAASLDTSINVHADGQSYTSKGIALTGASKPDAVGTSASTCGNWLGTSGNAQGGAVLSPGSFFAGFQPKCSTGAVVYCLQK